MKAGARSMANQVADNVRRTLGQERKRDSGDIWDVATTEAPPDEPPECQWCPVCQAARRLRDSGPGLGSRIADAGGVFASVMQDAFSAVEQVMKSPAPAKPASAKPAASKPAPAKPASVWPAAAAPAPAGPVAAEPAAAEPSAAEPATPAAAEPSAAESATPAAAEPASAESAAEPAPEAGQDAGPEGDA
jgi:hypothetical protein